MANDSVGKAVLKLVASVAMAACGGKVRSQKQPYDFQANKEASKKEMQAIREAGANLRNSIKNK